MRVALLVGRDPSHRYSLHRGYVDAVWEVGGTPVVLTPPPADALDRYLEVVAGCDALCVTGGGDVDPDRYGARGDDGLMDVDPRRDAAELAAVDAALAAGATVLGICRGIQLIAVARGGTLHADLPAAGYTGHWEEERQHEPVHAISVDGGSVAESALAGATVVNSIHHQAVLDPGPHLRVTGRSDDGVIEAIESDGVLGVQWHPERLWTSDARHLAPFRWLVA
jgi:putative glutamine amidotransferase